MSSDKKREELMYKRFPKCVLCESDEGYQFSGWFDYYVVQCRHCGAEWLLYEWLSEPKARMKLVKLSRDPVRRTVIGQELLRKEYPIDFWQKIKIKRLRVKAKEVKEPEILEVKEVKETKPSALWWLVPFFFGILGGIIAYVGVKEDDKEMAVNLLGFGIIIFFFDLLIIAIFYVWLQNLFRF